MIIRHSSIYLPSKAGTFLFRLAFYLPTVLLSVSSLFFQFKAKSDAAPLRVFIFAGQSNMVGSDSKVKDIQRFPPFRGLESPQTDVKFSYCIGRENKMRSNGWVDLESVDEVVGPELSFARKVTRTVEQPIAIIKCAAGGTTLGADWNPDKPSGFKLYPVLMNLIKGSLSALDKQGIPYRIEGFMWHQGENDMFVKEFMPHYGRNLANFLKHIRHDLGVPKLKFYIGELCTKTIWGMDLRPRMHAISLGQKEVASNDPLATYVPTSHVGVEIGSPVGLHYHYGTLGQLEHGVNYADAYLEDIGMEPESANLLPVWPYPKEQPINLFILAGHRNMEGERAFVQDVTKDQSHLLEDRHDIAFKYSIGGGVKKNEEWEPLGPAGYYDTFGPELSFGSTLAGAEEEAFAIAKFTHSGSQIIDWTPEGSEAKTRNVYPSFLKFVRDAVQSLESRGHDVHLQGIFYHLGENDMSMGSYRRKAPEWVASVINQSRIDLELPELKWFVTQQAPIDYKDLGKVDVTAALAGMAEGDPELTHIKVFDLPGQDRPIVLTTPGIVELGERLAEAYIQEREGMGAIPSSYLKALQKKFIETGDTMSNVLRIGNKDSVLYHHAENSMDERDRPIDQDTLFPIWSMTKPVTSLAAMILHEEGFFQLDDPVSKVIPALDQLQVKTKKGSVPLKRSITYRDLLLHTSGIAGYDGSFDQEGTWKEVMELDDLESLIDLLISKPLEHQPGERHTYGLSTAVLGHAIEKHAGQSLDVFFRERIFEPLDMHRTQFHLASDDRRQFQPLFVDQGDKFRIGTPKEDELYYRPGSRLLLGGEGLVSTIEDYGRFCQLLLNAGSTQRGRQIISQETLNLMLKDQLGSIPGFGGRESPHVLGFGFHVLKNTGKDLTGSPAGIFGWGGYHTTHFWVDPVNQIYGLFMTRRYPYHDDIEAQIRRTLYAR
ncbi:MAG: serine hydrolase [Verrucomicrobia bacterium]|jgi:CubicO group peptidase (beta-lactamase class C family)|nr:serine hydrolase [Verrucomicrobiota bacterium]